MRPQVLQSEQRTGQTDPQEGKSAERLETTQRATAIVIMLLMLVRPGTILVNLSHQAKKRNTPRVSCNNAPFQEGFLEGFSNGFEKVLRRVLRRCFAVDFNGKKGSEKGS